VDVDVDVLEVEVYDDDYDDVVFDVAVAF